MKLHRLLAAGLVLAPSLVILHAQETGLGRHKQLYAVPAPGKVEIDGKLDDWDLSGQIDMFVVADGKDSQSAKFAIMYDSEALYLGAVVRDTSPMMNRQDPKANGNRGWDADSCQFRLTVDPAQPYPIQQSTFEYKDPKNPKQDTRDDIVHLTLWHYTDRDKAALSMQLGMTFRTPRPEWAPFGVIPGDLYQGKYAKMADGKGYTFEYRIPWSTLGAKAPLKGGNTVAGTVQFNWGREDGLKTGGGAAWAYDVMSGPGFVFQNTGVWGKIIFSEKGEVAKELVEAGVPQAKPNPLKFTYELPRDGEVTIQLFDDQNLIRRTMVAQAARTKGKNTEEWDGMDDNGKPLPPGTYTVKGIIHDPIKGEFQFSVHNSGVPPYPTADNKGGWGGDHGAPSGCSAFDGGMLLAWEGAEYGWGVIRVDAEGRKQWGIKNTASYIANDGRRFFLHEPAGFQSSEGVKAFDLADGRPLNLGGESEVKAPEGGDKESNKVTGIACATGKLFISYGARNLIGVFDSTTGKPEAQWQVPKPGVLAARPDGSLVGISDGKLVAVKDGKTTLLGDKNLDTPSGVAVDAKGFIYVSNMGKRNDVTVYGADGKFLRSIGKAGGRPAMGRYDAKGLFKPNGIAIDAQDRLWVAEEADAPKRISVWNAATGAFEKEFFGGSSYFGYATIDPAVPDEIYAHNVLWKIDWEKKTTTPITTIWRKSLPDMVAEPLVEAYPQGFRMFTTKERHQFGWGLVPPNRDSAFYRREGDLFKPFLAVFRIDRKNDAWKDFGDATKLPNGNYLWQDANNDQRMQPEEFQPLAADKKWKSNLNIKDISADLTIWLNGGHKLKPVSIQPNGQPVYDAAKIEATFLTGTPAGRALYLWLDPDGSIYTLANGQSPSLVKWSPEGKMEWGYPYLEQWQKSLGLPPVRAGRLWGTTGPLGVAGDVFGNMTYFGVCHLFLRNGIYVAAIGKDGRTAASSDMEMLQPEGQGGSMVRLVTKPGSAPRTFILAGGQDSRVTEVLGLDTIQPLPEWKFTLSEEEAKIASDAITDFNAKNASSQKLVLSKGLDSLKNAALIPRDVDGARGFKAAAAYDEKNLYVSYEVTSPAELINANTEPKLLFKAGNCLDIQIAADSSADPARKTPVPGDVRLLVTRQLGADGKKPETYAVLFRPKVKGFSGEPIVLTSPTGKESFDEINIVQGVDLKYTKTPSGFTAVATIPLELLGVTLKAGTPVRMDLGYIFGNEFGTSAMARAYLKNRSFSANVLKDVPNESRLEPAEWDEVQVNP
jgi:DNA-binding beta-propeller fold protein YncE